MENYHSNRSTGTEQTNERFSIFSKGYRNQKGEAVLATRPQESRDIRWVYDYIVSERARWATETLRSMIPTATKDELSDFKKMNFENPNGSFALIEWLDRMIALLDKYEDEIPVQKRGKRGRRR